MTVSVDYVGPLQITQQHSTYILLFTDYFSRRADVIRLSPPLINQCMLLWGRPRVAPSRTSASSSAPSFHASSTSFLVFESRHQLLPPER